MAEQPCDYCGEPVGAEPIRRGIKAYCSEACAFEASRSSDCAGRADSGGGFKQPLSGRDGTST